MKNLNKIFLILLFCFLFIGCLEDPGLEETSPNIYLSGPSRFVFYDYELVMISSVSNSDYIKCDTICLNSFNSETLVSGGILMKQNYENTALERRFIIGVTQWEFDGYHLYCDFTYFNDGIQPLHDPLWVNFGGGLLNDYSNMKITNDIDGTVTHYTFDSNNNGNGCAIPSKMTLLSPEMVTSLYHADGSVDENVSVRILLKFMR